MRWFVLQLVLYYYLYCILRLVGKRKLGRVTYCWHIALVCVVLYYNLYCILRTVGKRELGRVTYCVQAADWKPGLRTAGAAPAACISKCSK